MIENTEFLIKSIIAVITLATIFHYSAKQQQNSNIPAKEKETLSKKIIFPVFILFIAVFSIELYQKKIDITISFAGIIILFISGFFYEKGITTLGKNYSTNIEIKKQHRLVKNGLFAIVRHPLYLCSFFLYLGIALAANSIVCLAIIAFAILPWIFYRISLEEKMLEKEFRKAFTDYKKETPMFIPKLF